jgi:hypothetical protein
MIIGDEEFTELFDELGSREEHKKRLFDSSIPNNLKMCKYRTVLLVFFFLRLYSFLAIVFLSVE